MAVICKSCNQPMLTSDGCRQVMPWPMVPFPGWDAYGVDTEPVGGRCRCGCLPEYLHHNGCDMEDCGRCGGQVISCGCIETWIDLADQGPAVLRRFIRVLPTARANIERKRYGQTTPFVWPPTGS